MKNKDIHNNLENKEVRDFLAKESIETARNALYETDLEKIESEIKELQARLESAKKYLTIKLLIQNQGWESFDISDDIAYNENDYFDFIGTLEEYHQFVKSLK